MTCGSILFTEADRALTLTHQLVTYPCLVTISLSHIMTHDIMINERKIKCFIKGIFYKYPFIYILLLVYNVCKS